jgi:GNAT superfamily N-acetyltransferase
MTEQRDALVIAGEPLGSEAVQVLIAALNAELSERYPNPEDNFFSLSEDEVQPGSGAFLVARLGGRAVGCGAVRRIEPTTAEIKRMYVTPEARGHGVARQILAALEAEARRIGATRVVLETGERQHEAIALYTRAGFARIPCFGEYADAPLSVCLGKTLS